MGLSVTVITAFSNVVISLLRKTIPNRIRIIVQLVVVAALVTIVSEILKAFAYDVSVQLSVYVGLIITNCLMLMPPMALIIVACIIWYQRARHKELQEESN